VQQRIAPLAFVIGVVRKFADDRGGFCAGVVAAGARGERCREQSPLRASTSMD
jgi:hypothetical protein